MTRGGKRIGAGRKAKFQSPSVVMRVPEHLKTQITALIDHPDRLNLPLYSSGVSAGFPSPADDHIEAKLDLNEHLIKRPSATFFVRANGDSMLNAGIHDGDLLIVDRSLEARKGNIVIVSLDGELTVKRLDYRRDQYWLMPENADYNPIWLNPESDIHLWGVVTNVIHAL